MNKTTLFSALLLIIAMIVPHSASAYDFKVGAIYYNITGDNTVSVTYKDTNLNSYSGTVNIPATVTSIDASRGMVSPLRRMRETSIGRSISSPATRSTWPTRCIVSDLFIC